MIEGNYRFSFGDRDVFDQKLSKLDPSGKAATIVDFLAADVYHAKQCLALLSFFAEDRERFKSYKSGGPGAFLDHHLVTSNFTLQVICSRLWERDKSSASIPRFFGSISQENLVELVGETNCRLLNRDYRAARKHPLRDKLKTLRNKRLAHSDAEYTELEDDAFLHSEFLSFASETIDVAFNISISFRRLGLQYTFEERQKLRPQVEAYWECFPTFPEPKDL